MSWQTASDYNRRAWVEATMNRWKQVIGDELRAQTDERRATEVAVAVDALIRMRDLGRLATFASHDSGCGQGWCARTPDSCTTLVPAAPPRTRPVRQAGPTVRRAPR